VVIILKRRDLYRSW